MFLTLNGICRFSKSSPPFDTYTNLVMFFLKKIGATPNVYYFGTYYHVNTNEWTLYSQTWATNPYTGNPWTAEEIDAVEKGVWLFCSNSWTPIYDTRCTYFYSVDDRGAHLVSANGTEQSVQLIPIDWSMWQCVLHHDGDSSYVWGRDQGTNLYFPWLGYAGSFYTSSSTISVGYIWVEGNYFAFLDSGRSKKLTLGTITGVSGNAGYCWVDGNYLYYTDNTGAVRRILGTLTTLTGKTSGQISINLAQGGSKCCYIDSLGKERCF